MPEPCVPPWVFPPFGMLFEELLFDELLELLLFDELFIEFLELWWEELCWW
ncbi:hypothetical protein [Streptomyces sp. NPDC001621]|uniref:hypothetical protein n=1 Tax=Streptomyces sp. NPDC001621 TaxID=3364594 RepID=UPI00369DD401